MRLLVTGHLGYIGSVLTPMLLERGHEVVGLDSDMFRRCTYGDPGSLARVPMFEQDIRDVGPDELRGFDAVLHLAALSNDPLGDIDPDLTDEINHRAAVRLAEFAKRAGVGRFVFSSTCSNYGAAGQEFLSEDSPFNPVTPYGQAKVAAEGGIRALAGPGFAPVTLRSGTACGCSPRIRFDLVLNNLTAWAVSTGRVHLKSDGMAWRPIVHVEDIARAFVAVTEADADRVHDRAYNVGRTDQNFRVREIAEVVHATVPGSEIAFGEGAGRDARNYRVSCDRIRAELPEFEPRWTLAESARQLHDEMRARGLTLEEFEGDRFQRLAHVRALQEEGVIDGRLRRTRVASRGFATRARGMACRVCGSRTLRPVLDLGNMPRSDGLLPADAAPGAESTHPLELAFCESCALAQILETLPPDALFGEDYLYFSSYSRDLLEHSRRNAEALVERLGLGAGSLVVELASNDGYMLKNFAEWGIPVLGVEPAPKQARAARDRGIETVCDFFGTDLARELRAQGRAADLIIANNVLAHVADTHGFVEGMRELLSDDGTICIEVPYVVDLIDHNEFDTIYHEHLCYFCVHSLVALFGRHGLWLNDVQRIPIHGGSLRLFVQKRERVGAAVHELLDMEREHGVTALAYYERFADRVMTLRDTFRGMLDAWRAEGKRVTAYGAAAKGTIMLNFLGADPSLLECAYDRNPHKQGKLMPGVRLPIRSVDDLRSNPPDYLVILPWNFKDEIMRQEAGFSRAGGRFVIPVPEPTVL